MFNNMSKIFLLTCSPAVTTTIDDPQGRKVPCTVDYVRKQIELCKSILLFFRSLAINIDLSTESWTTLLSTLLEVLNLTMVGRLPSDRVDDCWLSNEKLIRFMFQTMNIALLRASLVVPIANSLWDQCLTVYSQLTQWPALIIEWRTAMEILTSTMARLVYGVDLASIPDEKKSRHGKRNPGQPAIARTRPKSFTDAAVNYLPGTPVPLPATTALSQSSVHVTSGDIAATGGMVSQNIPIMDGESSHGRLSSCSNNRVRTPNVPTTAAEWSEARADGSNNFEFARLNADPPPIFQADEEDSVSLDLNGALGEDETDTEMRSRNRSKSRITIPRSTAGTPRQDKRGTLVPSTDSNFFSLRRAASEVILTFCFQIASI
ncbi:putative tuberin [Fasciola hepatica]|uniref:Tuberin n=1 Tax=Fasciola hepatica TaxID=6192 RepID=A0A4E0QUR4_FASHE|nr:putative tuberin [Fasciola hepatica]